MSTKIHSIKGQKEDCTVFDGDYDVFDNSDELLICNEVVRMFFPRRKNTPEQIVIKAHSTNKQSKAKRGWVKVEILGSYSSSYLDWRIAGDDDYRDMYMAMSYAIKKHFPKMKDRLNAEKECYLFIRIEELK